MKVIFNADDFGLTPGVNQGIVQSHLKGVVKSTTMLVGMAAEKDAIALAKELPSLKVGLHLRFTLGLSMTGHPSFSNQQGEFYAYEQFWNQPSYSEQAIYEECVAQVEAFLMSGLRLSHLDSHHHIHTHPSFLSVVTEVAAKYQVPLRGQTQQGLRYKFSEEFYDQGVKLDTLITHLTELKSNYDVVEIMCHPAIVDQALVKGSGYTRQREEELSILTDDKLAVMLSRHSIEVTDYSALTISSDSPSV